MPPGETLFITFRLKGTVPSEILRQLKEEYTYLVQRHCLEHESLEAAQKRLAGNYFIAFDQYLDACSSGADWLKEEAIALLVKQSLLFGQGTHYHLHAFCIMPNHVHALVTPLREDVPFYQILQRLKTYTAVRANRLLHRAGKSFWQPESYDHVVRNSESFRRIVAYILNNPVKAGLVDNWEDWPNSYCEYL